MSNISAQFTLHMHCALHDIPEKIHAYMIISCYHMLQLYPFLSYIMKYSSK